MIASAFVLKDVAIVQPGQQELGHQDVVEPPAPQGRSHASLATEERVARDVLMELPERVYEPVIQEFVEALTLLEREPGVPGEPLV